MLPKLEARKMLVGRAKSHSSGSRFVRRRVEPLQSDLANLLRRVGRGSVLASLSEASRAKDLP
jgi:hypothetical protein